MIPLVGFYRGICWKILGFVGCFIAVVWWGDKYKGCFLDLSVGEGKTLKTGFVFFLGLWSV